MTKILSLKSVSETRRVGNQNTSEDYVVFGGTFDPFHVGHLSVVRSLIQLFSTTIIATSGQNPWKEAKPTPVEMRLEMIRRVLNAEGICFSETLADSNLILFDKAYIYAAEVVKELRALRAGTLYWAVGEDSAETVCKWKDWSTLNVPVIALPLIEPIHASGIRSGEQRLHPALIEYANEQRLYGHPLGSAFIKA